MGMYVMRFFLFFSVFFNMLGIVSCTIKSNDEELPYSYSSNTGNHFPDSGGKTAKFKIPLLPGFNWEITQSWASHCELCNQKGYDTAFNGFFGNYCTEMSHMAQCFDACKYGWDFNLPGNSDEGKSVLASGNGYVEEIGNNSWGNYVIINHGDDLCTRYAHLLDNSITVEKDQYVCQGLKIGEIGGTPSYKPHLHFQFEECSTHDPVPGRFDDGNGIPVCTIGDDIFNADGEYTALKLTNKQVIKCSEGETSFSGGELDDGGWVNASCGALPSCPLIPNCGREAWHKFEDYSSMTTSEAEAAAYLYGECALDGKSDGELHSDDKVTRAEALKVPLFLFGLMNDCGSSETFFDVDVGDWYFSVVACGVKHGIVDTISDYFDPNDEVTFSEAAKFVVKSAQQAGVVEFETPSEGHFPHIEKSHWAYKYVETLYSYGGVTEDSLNSSPDDEIERGDFIIMVSSLSPCFCKNVLCDDGCLCDQATFACIDPDDQTPGTGGNEFDSDSDDESDDDSNDESNDDSDESGEFDEKEFYLNIECSVDLDNTRCEDPYTVLSVKCSMSNDGEEVVKINDLVMAMTDANAEEVCQVTDPYLQNGGVGTKNVDPGETKSLNGHYEISCTSLPSDPEIDVQFDLAERIEGVVTWYYGLLSTSVSATGEMFGPCEDEDSPCVSDCAGKECGPDYCGGFCGYCSSGHSCNYDAGQCIADQPACTPLTCAEFGYNCGLYNNGCGGNMDCGVCANGECLPERALRSGGLRKLSCWHSMRERTVRSCSSAVAV